MKICIPTQTDQGLNAEVHAHFGSAAYFTIYDTEKESIETIDNGNMHHAHGTCHPMKALGLKDIDAVVCAGMGARAVMGLNAAGIKAFRVQGGSVSEVIKQFAQSTLEEITPDNACSQHNCH
ncbi:MAG: NifB/NifX family molybdenum-iron cluster-binding protein [Candidatus Omnitrophica bacterium]|nr:NifB/NifX family molybdenum-iron cluster-binding protein [Candidatus Omnitrophota bacterium]